MSRPSSDRRHAGPGRWAGAWATGLMLVMVPSGPAGAGESLYPPAGLFRSLQLTALACGRDNDAASCDKARAVADPLLDHPRLSATCKDTLWAIREKAVVAAVNSPERRDGIDRAAKDVTVFCRQPARPTPAPAAGNAGGGAPSSFFNAPKSR